MRYIKIFHLDGLFFWSLKILSKKIAFNRESCQNKFIIITYTYVIVVKMSFCTWTLSGL